MTTTAIEIVTDNERVILEDLDFDIPCGYKGRGYCDQPARWIMFLRPHCKGCRWGYHLLCQEHHDYIASGREIVSCSACQTLAIQLLNYVDRFEPIKKDS